LERIIEQNKEQYYETVQRSSQRWHEGKHDPWPYVNFILFRLKTAYQESVERAGHAAFARGAKTELVVSAIEETHGSFSVGDLQSQCPDVSPDMIRRVLKDLRAQKAVECLGRGPKAQWRTAGKRAIG
jgi:hypothetical protein